MDDRISSAILKLQVRSGWTVRDLSMEHTFYDGDLVSVAPTDFFKAGDIAAFHYGHEGLPVHRIQPIGEG